MATVEKVIHMSMSPREFLALLKSVKKELDGVPSPKEMRADLADFSKRVRIADGVTSEAVDLNKVPCLRIAPETPNDGHVLYFHGGGYISGSPSSHLGVTSEIAGQTQSTVWSADYRLAPEDPFPAAVDDAIACYRALLEKVGTADRIIVAGDSAGGGLSVALMFLAREQNLPLPAGLALMSPFADLTLSGWSHSIAKDRDFLATPEVLEVMAGWYAGEAEKTDPLVSPYRGDFSGFPPMLVHVGSEEVLLSDSMRLAERAGAAGASVEVKVWPLMPHVFQLHTKFLADANASVEEISAWITRRMASAGAG